MSGTKPPALVPRGVARRTALAALVLAATFTGCSHETGPSLSIEVFGESLAPSSTIEDADSLCCCRVRGTVRNTCGIAVDVNINFDAQGAGGSLGTAIDWVANIQPGAEASFDAAGIIAPCDQVTGLAGRHRITGVFVGSGGS